MTSFATPAELASKLQIATIDAVSAQQALDAATAVVQNETRQTFSVVTGDVLTLEVDGSRDIFLPQLPVTVVTSVQGRIYGSAAVTTYLADVDYIVTGNRIRWYRWYGGTWPNLVVVTYNHGYVTIPDDVKAACLEVAAELYSYPTNDQGGERIDDYTAPSRSVRAPGENGPILTAVVRRYRRRGRSMRFSA